MPDLDFRVEDASVIPFAAAPLLGFQVAIANSGDEPVFSVALRCQIRIEANRRRYSLADQENLVDLFGEPDRWAQTLRSLLWTNVTATAPEFTKATKIEVQVPCTFDFNVAATKYFHGLGSGDIPLCFLFSGSIFYNAGDGVARVAPIPWSKESRFLLPARTWRDLMDMYYPNSAWLRLRRDVFERLYLRKIQNGITSWEAVIESILDQCESEVKQ